MILECLVNFWELIFVSELDYRNPAAIVTFPSHVYEVIIESETKRLILYSPLTHAEYKRPDP